MHTDLTDPPSQLLSLPRRPILGALGAVAAALVLMIAAACNREAAPVAAQAGPAAAPPAVAGAPPGGQRAAALAPDASGAVAAPRPAVPPASELTPPAQSVVVGSATKAPAAPDDRRERELEARERRLEARQAALEAREEKLRRRAVAPSAGAAAGIPDAGAPGAGAGADAAAEVGTAAGSPAATPGQTDEAASSGAAAAGLPAGAGAAGALAAGGGTPALPDADAAAEERTRPAVRVPVGTRFEVEFTKSLASNASSNGDIFRTRLLTDVRLDGGVAIPAGSEILGVVTDAVGARRIGGKARLSVKFTDLVLPSGTTVPIHASFFEEGKGKVGQDAATIGGGAAGGALLGRLLGGSGRGTILGALVGAAVGTAIASKTSGEEVVIPEGSVVKLRLDEPLDLKPRR